ncbi:putative CDK4/6 [Lophiotrema nucula]|uniref:Putative CDK4/6 n=1 Tax=Lophiotrema nucula TaxID=690887 RepID=A0A6A5YHT9_9PLEO|nr:putative CDK4/6 [Lophiotrema nucula]
MQQLKQANRCLTRLFKRRHLNLLEIISDNEPLEEETLHRWTSSRFYPVEIGEKLCDRYLVLGKLGFGGNSTIWLCKDVHPWPKKYVVVKVCTANSRQGAQEVKMYKHMQAIDTAHPGQQRIRRLDDGFQVLFEDRYYYCLVHKPLAMSLRELRTRYADACLPLGVVKFVVQHVLLGLDFLHANAGVVHTDLQDGNIMFPLHSDSRALKHFERDEKRHPSARKYILNTIIYRSRKLMQEDGFPLPSPPVITDFGQARRGEAEYTDYYVQPSAFQAPEVLMEIPWSDSIDIWNLGGLIYYLLFNKFLFSGGLQSVISVLGPPPMDLLWKSGIPDLAADGSWMMRVKAKGLRERLRPCMDDGKDKEELIRFLGRMLTWRAGDRATAGELLRDRWFSSV